MRTSRKCLESLVSAINGLTGAQVTEWRTVQEQAIQEQGISRNVAPVGAYTLDHAYGGYSLHRYVNEGGAVDAVIDARCTAGEMEGLLRAFIKGISVGKAL